ncbi:MAG: M48 family metallopeptidase [Gracilimonas sp.]|uniref:M48 family metallopeptidase n=1 Tax=Gracilimonas sp. TaxID=1974203 RepID=UPI0019CBAA23|nr:SprT family zinc-dependent metalloprotease [Gracilimonas sp.]MBD3617746.1 M48 family metallopeptidase [Gracilimonas sp.]
MARKKTFSTSHLHISGLQVEVLRKNVKNLNLRVYPAEQQIRISVPRRIPEKKVIQFIHHKLPWIKKHLSNYQNKTAREPLRYISGEKHLFRGKEYSLKVIERNKPPNVSVIDDEVLILQVRPGSTASKKASVLNEWYRTALKTEIPELIEKWETPMGVSVKEFGVKLMKTRWGTCNIRAQRIWLNLELAKKRPELLEYVVIHEMVHLLERLHNKRFYYFMSRFLPNWKELKDELNGKSSISDC